MIRHFTGSLWICAVASSLQVIWKPPSPTIAQTFLPGLRELRADRGGQAEAHGPGAAAREPVPVAARAAELRGPHLVLAHVGGEDRVALRERVQAVEHVLRAQASLLRVLERILLAPAAHCFSHSAVSAISTSGIRSSITSRASPWIATSGRMILSNSAASMSMWILTASRQKSETRPVMRSSQRAADRHDQVAVDHGLVRVGRAVHAEHAEVQRVRLVDGALAEQRVHHRRAQLLGERGDRLAGVGDHRAVPDVEHRPARFAQQASGLGDARPGRRDPARCSRAGRPGP